MVMKLICEEIDIREKHGNQSVVTATDDDRAIIDNVSSVTRVYTPKKIHSNTSEAIDKQKFEAIP